MNFESRCDTCVADKRECLKCRENLIYKNVPTKSLYMAYIPTCPRGYHDCIRDPAYIKHTRPKWYKEHYGDLSPEEVSLKTCMVNVKEDPNEELFCYDDEDK